MDDLPWDDCKVAFGIDDEGALGRWMDRTEDGKKVLPLRWSLCEVDCAGARCVVVFRVEGELLPAAGRRVLDTLKASGAVLKAQAA